MGAKLAVRTPFDPPRLRFLAISASVAPVLAPKFLRRIRSTLARSTGQRCRRCGASLRVCLPPMRRTIRALIDIPTAQIIAPRKPTLNGHNLIGFHQRKRRELARSIGVCFPDRKVVFNPFNVCVGSGVCDGFVCLRSWPGFSYFFAHSQPSSVWGTQRSSQLITTRVGVPLAVKHSS